MKRYAVLIGAKDISDGIQRGLLEFKEFLTSGAGGFWREDEIMITGPLDRQFARLLQARLMEYDFVLVYRCGFSWGGAGESDWSGSLRSAAAGGRGVFISDACGEAVDLQTLGYEAECAQGKITNAESARTVYIEETEGNG